MSGRRVVVTGASGRIGRATAPLLPGDWDAVLTDLRPGDVAGRPVAALDATDEAACRAAFAGADAVVHLAGVPDPAASWEQLLPANVVAVHAVAAAAAAAGVRRLVLCSSLQAVSAPADVVQVRSGDPARPANLYGATKAWAESVGSWLAATTSTSVVVLRIGHFQEDRRVLDGATPRDRAAWLSVRDTAEVLRGAVEADAASLDGGFAVLGATSPNRYRKADLGETVQRLGLDLRDDAWEERDAG